jgi:hypothetical protein
MVVMVIRASRIAYDRIRSFYRSDGQNERRGHRWPAIVKIDPVYDRSPPLFPMAIGKRGQGLRDSAKKAKNPDGPMMQSRITNPIFWSLRLDGRVKPGHDKTANRNTLGA